MPVDRRQSMAAGRDLWRSGGTAIQTLVGGTNLRDPKTSKNGLQDEWTASGTFDYQREGELWIVQPETRLLARLGADPALVAGGSTTADVTGELVYIPPPSQDEIKAMAAAGPQEKYRGKLALMWSHARGDLADALDAAGICGVISFNAQERYLDPDQVIYSSGSYTDHTNLKLDMTVSWRQWNNLWEDLEGKQKIIVRARTRIEKYPGKFEMVYSWLPGTELGVAPPFFRSYPRSRKSIRRSYPRFQMR
jgi:hypothetical protein